MQGPKPHKPCGTGHEGRNRKEKSIPHQENEILELLGGHVPLIQRYQIFTKKTQYVFEYVGLIWALLKRISKPYVSLMYCHILPSLCEILFRRSLKISLSSSQDGWSTLSAWSAIPRHFPIRKRPPNPRTLPQELGRRIKICINLLILPQVFR